MIWHNFNQVLFVSKRFGQNQRPALLQQGWPFLFTELRGITMRKEMRVHKQSFKSSKK